ncbi:MAG: CDP-alcohol phosphatidyltransferase family protein [Thermogladius sp.]|nr:CDP-alcohol phosphatidyltransferase family protein [Thermogladius sp.]
MLARLRRRLKRKVEELGGRLGELGVKPVHLTITGLFLSVLAFLSSLKNSLPYYTIFLAFSGLMDMLDGPVARATGKASPLGAFLDSFLDRVSDALLIISLVNFGLDWGFVTSLLVASLLISYSRARAESLGVSLEGVGLVERGERIILLTATAVLLAVNFTIGFATFILFLALSLETVAHRFIYVVLALRDSKPR